MAVRVTQCPRCKGGPILYEQTTYSVLLADGRNITRGGWATGGPAKDAKGKFICEACASEWLMVEGGTLQAEWAAAGYPTSPSRG